MEIYQTWLQMPLLLRMYWLFAIISSIGFIFIFVISLFGTDSDASADTDMSVDGDIDSSSFSDFSSSIFSLKSIIGFLVAFSWIGIVALKNNISPIFAILLSIGAGLLVAIIIVLLLSFFAKMQYNGTMTTSDSLGALGEVYLSIPPNNSGKGKVQINVHNAIRTFDAITYSDFELHQFDKIRVTNIVDSDILVVEKIN